MEEGFKKWDEDDCDGGGDTTDVEDGGMEGVGDVLEDVPGVGDVLDGVEKEMMMGGDVLEGGCEDLKMESVPSWEIIRKEVAELQYLHLEGLNDACMVDGVDGVMSAGDENGPEGEVLGEIGQVLEETVKTFVLRKGVLKEKVVLNWKKAVVGGGERREVADRSHADEVEKVVGEENAAEVAVNGKNVAGGGNKTHEKGNGGGPVKSCRAIEFDEGGGGFLADDGLTVHVDRSVVEACEKSLERALVGRVLGRKVSFGSP